MPRKRSGLEQFQRDTYLLSRTAGDVSAAERGPGVLAKRIIRRKATGGFFRLLRQVTK
jgi:hypothetical protein